MKRLYMLGLLLGLSSTAFGFTETREINVASFTATNDVTAYIPNTTANTDFRGVVVGSPTATTGSIVIFDGQGTNATNKIATIGLGVANEFHYNVRLSSGITYTTTG